jgi:hypothetical protein
LPSRAPSPIILSSDRRRRTFSTQSVGNGRSAVRNSYRLCENTVAAGRRASLIRGGQAGRLEDSLRHGMAQRRCSLSLRSRVFTQSVLNYAPSTWVDPGPSLILRSGLDSSGLDSRPHTAPQSRHRNLASTRHYATPLAPIAAVERRDAAAPGELAPTLAKSVHP